MGNASIVGTKPVGNTQPRSSARSSETSPVLRTSGEDIGALPEYESSETAAPRIRIREGYRHGKARFEVSIPGRGVLDGEDKDAYPIIALFWLPFDYDEPWPGPYGDRQKMVDFANDYMSLAVECGIHPIALCEAARPLNSHIPEVFADFALKRSQIHHLGKNPDKRAMIAHAQSCIAVVLEKLDTLTQDVPLSVHTCWSKMGHMASLAGSRQDGDELKRSNGSAFIELLGDILAYHIPVLCRSRRLPHLVLAAKAVALGAPYLQRTEAIRSAAERRIEDDDPRFLKFEQESKKKIPEQLKVETLLRKLFKHAASALLAEDQERLEQCIEGLEALEDLSPDKVKDILEAIQKGLADQASIQAAVHREYLEEWFKDHGLVTAGHRVDFCIKQTEHTGAPYDSFTLSLKLIELAAAWACDPYGPVEHALAILGYVSAQSIKQGATTASHMKELRSACSEIADQLASSPLQEHNERAFKIDAFLAEGHFAVRQ
jgi:hypothetical protein